MAGSEEKLPQGPPLSVELEPVSSRCPESTFSACLRWRPCYPQGVSGDTFGCHDWGEGATSLEGVGAGGACSAPPPLCTAGSPHRVPAKAKTRPCPARSLPAARHSSSADRCSMPLAVSETPIPRGPPAPLHPSPTHPVPPGGCQSPSAVSSRSPPPPFSRDLPGGGQRCGPLS